MPTQRRIIVLLSLPVFLLASLRDYSWKNSSHRRRIAAIVTAVLCSLGVLITGANADAAATIHATIHATYRVESPAAPYRWSAWYKVTKGEPGVDRSALRGAENVVKHSTVRSVTVTVHNQASRSDWRAVQFHVVK